LLAAPAAGRQRGGEGVRVEIGQREIEEHEPHLAGFDVLFAQPLGDGGERPAGRALVVGELAHGDRCLGRPERHP
jgi:hypothetical protein